MSPAKIMDFESEATIKDSTIPEYIKDAEYLNGILKKWSVEDIQLAMTLNPKLAYQVYQFVQSFDLPKVSRKQAALAYNGIAYLGLEAESFTKQDWEFAQDHLVSLSGLYGPLRPMDEIKPYRLEASIKVENKRGKDLYAYWNDTITEYLSKRMLTDDNVLINLASNEYSKLINKKELPKDSRVITPVFKELVGDRYKTIVVYTKKCRGTMTRFIIQNKLTNAEDLKHFDVDGYSFSPDLSKGDQWVFAR